MGRYQLVSWRRRQSASVLVYYQTVCAVLVETEPGCGETSAGSVGDLETTPVSAAIARHLNIDLSLEGRAARNRRGIALVVHGAPASGN